MSDAPIPSTDITPELPDRPITYEEVQRLAEAFERSAKWLNQGLLEGPARTHPLVGTADYSRASIILRTAAFLWAQSNTEG